MSWDRTGESVTGAYLEQFDFTGVVESSRVTYGGAIQHTILLGNEIIVFDVARERLLVLEGDLK